MMEHRYEVIYNESKGVLSIYKITDDNNIVSENEGRYGIITYRNFNGDVVKWDIPEPDFILTVDIEDIKRFGL